MEYNASLEDYAMIYFTIIDIHGIPRSKGIPRSGFEHSFTNGTDFYTGVTGFGFRGEITAASAVCAAQEATLRRPLGNMTARPIPNTLHQLPYIHNDAGKCKVGQVFCETFHISTGERVLESVRYIAEKMLGELQCEGYELFSGFELEFILVDRVSDEPAFDNCGDIFRSSMLIQHSGVINEIVSVLEAMEVEIEGFQSEYSPGQFEFSFKPQVGLKIVDNICKAKECIREVSRKHGFRAIFMTQFKNKDNSNGMHFSHSLRKVGSDETSVFSDVSGVDKLSPVCRSWLGGLTHHFPALNAICSPTVNCYRRLDQPWTPYASTWSLDNRFETYRVKNYSPKNTYIESRLPSGSANPYLVLAATVAAGLDGIKSKLPCPLPEPHSEPTSDVYTHMEASKIPRDLAQALEFLEQDACLISALGPDFVKWFSILKREELDILKDSDVKKNNTAMISEERALYINMI